MIIIGACIGIARTLCETSVVLLSIERRRKMFFVGLLVGIVIGAVWMVGARIVVKMRRDNVVGTPSASHNSVSPKLPASMCTRCRLLNMCGDWVKRGDEICSDVRSQLRA